METPVIFVPIGIVLYIIGAALYQIGRYYFKKLSQYLNNANSK
jgi:hypothetical protein